MRHSAGILLLALATACGSLPTTGDGVVALELLVPRTLSISPGDSLTLRARAVDRFGDSIAAPIRWRTVDTLIISLDSISGLVVPVAGSGSGRAQAVVGSLRSDPITITIKAAAP